MAAKLKLMRVGKKHAPSFRLVVTDSRKPTNSDYIELLGHIDFVRDNEITNFKEDRALYWLGVGVEYTEGAKAVLRKAGTWAKFVASKKDANNQEAPKPEN